MKTLTMVLLFLIYAFLVPINVVLYFKIFKQHEQSIQYEIQVSGYQNDRPGSGRRRNR